MKLLTKALLVTSIAITVLLGATGWLVQRYALRTTRQGLEEEVRASLSAYESLWRSRAEMLRSLSLVISSMSDVRAAFSTGDEATIRDTAAELWSRISRDDAIFLVTDPTGHVIASLGGATQTADLPIMPTAATKFPEQAVGFMRTGQQLFQVVITPVYVQAQHGPALLNVLVAGYPVTASLAANLKQSTGSDFVYRSGGQTLVSTLGEDANAKLSSGALPASEYAVLSTPLISVDGMQLGELLIVRSFEIALRHLSALQTDLLTIWAIAVAAGVFLSYFLTRRIVDPIVRLNHAATAVAGRNYDSRVPVESQDELGRLAQTFNNMCESIQAARKELIHQERLATIGHLSTSIVHDLRNPLAAVYGGSEMLVDGELAPPTVKRLARNIYNASRRIQELLQDLVNISRGKIHSPEICSLKDLVGAACEPLQSTAQMQNIDIRIDVPDTLETSVERARMERVFFNLCTNALEAMDDGGTIRISAVRSGGSAVVRIEDTGPGIPAEVQSRLFEPFATAGKKNGLGLGLALSRQTVVAHGGDLWADSTSRGAAFCVRIPLLKQ